MQPIEKILKEFDEIYPTVRCVSPQNAFITDSPTASQTQIKSFIESKLQADREAVKKMVDGMKVKEIHSNGCLNEEYPSECDCIEIYTTSSHNQALEAILTKLNNLR